MAPTVSGTPPTPAAALTATPFGTTPPGADRRHCVGPHDKPVALASASAPSLEIVRTTASFGAPPRRAGLGVPLPPGVSRLPAVQRESAPRPEATAPATGVGGSPSRTSAPAPETGSEPVPSRDEPVTPPRRHDPVVPVDDVPPEIAPLVGLRRLPTTMDDGLSTPDEPSATPSDLAARIQRQAASFVTAPNPFRVGAGPEPPAGPPGQAPEQALDVIAPLVAERRFVSSSALAGVRSLGPVSPSPGQPPAVARLHSGPSPRPVPVFAARVQRTAETSTARSGTTTGPLSAGSTATATAADPTGFVDAGAVAVAAGLAHRDADGSVVFGPGSPSPSAEWGSPVSAARVTSEWPTQRQVSPDAAPHAARRFAVQRAAADSPAVTGPATVPVAAPVRRVPVAAPVPRALATPSPAPTWAAAVQREADAGEASSAPASEPPLAAGPDTAPTAPPADAGTTSGASPGAAPTAAPAALAAPAAAGPAAMTDRDVDRLARRLYPRLRDHLRGELRLDRERLGRASDVGMRG